MVFDLDKLRSIAQVGKTAGTVKVEATGSGAQVHYADGRIEGVVRPAPVHRTVSMSDGRTVPDE